MFRKIYKAIKKYDNIVIARHVGVDPDAMASQIGLRDSILATFPKKNVLAVGNGGGKFSYLGKLDHYEGDGKNTLLIVLDTPDQKRVDCTNVDQFEYRIKIDHHPFVESFCDIELVNDKSSSTCELIMEMIYKTKLKATKEIMEKLYQGLVSDTNRFMFNNTTASTFSIVSRVIKDYELSVFELHADLYMRPLKEIRLQGYMAQNYQITENKVGYLIINDETLKQYNVDAATPGNLINSFNHINEMLVWVTATEDKELGSYRVSIRSRGPIINEVAAGHGGGGHIYASGTRLKTEAEIMSLIIDLEKVSKQYIEKVSN